MTWGRIIKGEAPLTAEELEELEERRKGGRIIRKLALVTLAGLAVVSLQQCAAIGASVAECPPSESAR